MAKKRAMSQQDKDTITLVVAAGGVVILWWWLHRTQLRAATKAVQQAVAPSPRYTPVSAPSVYSSYTAPGVSSTVQQPRVADCSKFGI
jgi:hypothetical protein